MKSLALLILAALGMILLAAGVLHAFENPVIRNICFIGGAAILFLFYILAIIKATRIQRITPAMRVLWLIVIISVPVVGAVIFLAVDKDPNKPMIPETNSWAK